MPNRISPLQVFKFLQANGIRIQIDGNRVKEHEVSKLLAITSKPSWRVPEVLDYHIRPRNPKQELVPYYHGRDANHPGGITIGANDECMAVDNIDPVTRRAYYIFYRKK